MKTLTVIVCCLLAVDANVLRSDVQREWQKFVATHKKMYSNAEEHEFRFKIFKDNFAKIVKHNREFEEGRQTYNMAINAFGDLLETEFIEKMTGFIEVEPNKRHTINVELLKGEEAPESVDWREKGAVTAVKDQGACGSCWSFSATGALEGQHFMKTGDLVSLSEKNLMDCSWSYGNYGCGGGWMDSAFQYVIDNKGIDTEESYPYEPVDGSCEFDPDNIGATAIGYVDLPVGDESSLRDAVATVGPIAVAINANFAFQFYSSGVFKDSSCSPEWLNHGVLAVGYGTEESQDYWIVKNSWGASWGENGYIKMARNYNNMCGISQVASYPTM